MEKIILKPVVQELLHKNNEPSVHFDAFAYQGSSNQEKNLGTLLITGHIKYSDEDLSYIVSLISSLARREYYSEESIHEQNPKSAFSRTLKKLNEVLEEFFKNKNFKLSIGLAAIAGDNIFISRLGRFKITLARRDQLIDILNNIELFSKDTDGEKQFSNIISGKLQANDKLFACFPTRSLTAREKQLNAVFLKENQTEFVQKVAQLAANVSSFSCCGIHVAMEQIKEIPVQTMPKDSTPRTVPPPSEVMVKPTKNAGEKPGGPAEESAESANQETSADIEEQPRIIPAELSVTKRNNIFSQFTAQFKKLGSLNRLNGRAKARIFILIIAIVVAASLASIILRATSGQNSQIKNTIKLARGNLNLAESRLNQQNIREARSFLQAALANISGLPAGKVEDIKKEIYKTLDNLNHVSEGRATVLADLTNQTVKNLTLITGSDSGPTVANDEGNLVFVGRDNTNFKLNLKPKFLFNSKSYVVGLENSGKLEVLNSKSKKINYSSLKSFLVVSDASLYEDNLYLISESKIYKYADVTTSGVKRTEWSKETPSDKLISLAVDGNVYALTDQGKLIKYFKGKKAGEFDLQLTPGQNSKLLTNKDGAFIYLVDKTNRIVYVFEKSSGALKTTYHLDNIDQLQDAFVSKTGTIWLLGADKVWQLNP